MGGYGAFGGQLAELLADISDIEMLICGRSPWRATAFCNAFEGRAIVRPITLDRKDIAAELAIHRPGLVVDASGPFQEYTDRTYLVITSCIDAGLNYLDFADAADFAFGISEFEAAAKAAGVFVLSGVSSLPLRCCRTWPHGWMWCQLPVELRRLLMPVSGSTLCGRWSAMPAPRSS